MATSAKRRFKAHNYPNASLVKRVMAMVYDSLLVLAVWMLVGYIAIAFNDGQAVKGPWFNSILFMVTYGFFCFILGPLRPNPWHASLVFAGRR